MVYYGGAGASKCGRRAGARLRRVARTNSGVGGRRTGCVDAMRRCVNSGICADRLISTLASIIINKVL